MKPAPAPPHADPVSTGSEPTRAETLVREILAEILVRSSVPVEELDATVPLGELGCDSIDLLQLAATLKQRFGLDLEGEQGATPRWTLQELARRVEREQGADR